MATSFKLIYDKFLGKIDDYELGLVTDEELNEVLFGYLDEARSLHFSACQKNLDNIVENLGVGEFEETLTSQEQQILALGMKLAWLSTKKNDSTLMQKDIGDRDYKAVQGDKYLKVLSTLEKELKDSIRDYEVQYTYKDFSLRDW